MKKILFLLIMLSFSFHADTAEKSFVADKIIVYGFENGKGNKELLDSLSKAGLSYIFCDLNAYYTKSSEVEKKIRLFFGKNFKHYYPVVDVNGFILLEPPVELGDIKPFLNRNLNSKDRAGANQKVNALDLENAIKEHDKKMVELLLASGTDPNTRYREEYFILKPDKSKELKVVNKPLLFYIYDHKNLLPDEKFTLLSLFLKAGADPNVTNEENKSLLDIVLFPYASRKNDQSYRNEITRLSIILIEHGADVNKLDNRGNSPLFHATYLGLTDIIPLIVKKGGNINHENNSGESVIMYLSYGGNFRWKQVADTLLELGADINHTDMQGQTMLYKTANCPDITVQSSTEVNGKKGNSKTSIVSLKNDSLEIVKYLVSKNADVNLGDLDGLTPLYVAQKAKAPAIVSFLKSKGGVTRSFRCDKDNSSPLCVAVKNRDIAAIDNFTEKDFKQLRARTSDGVPSTPLHLAVELGDIGFLKALCAKKVNWNITDRYRRTPLFIAVTMNRSDIIDLLCANGADPNAAAWYGTTPYSIAAIRNTAMIDRLLKSGKKPADAGALVDATMSGNIDSVKKLYPLLKNHEDAKNPKLTELAVDFGYTDIVRYLADSISIPKTRAEELIAKTELNRKRFSDFEKTSPGISSVEKKTGGISGKKGAFKFTLEEWSPFSGEKTDLDLKKLPVNIFVPDGYDGSNPFGLMVYMSGQQPTPEYRKIMEKYNIIWVGFNCYSIEYKPLSKDIRHDIFALAVVYNLARYYNIDPERVYLSGMSWGGRLTGRIIVKYPHIFRGGIAMGGCQPDYVWDMDKKEFNSSLYSMQNKSTLVFCAGDFDYNRDEAYKLYDYCRSRGFKKIFYLQEFEKGHEAFSGEYFEKAINLLEANVNRK